MLSVITSYWKCLFDFIYTFYYLVHAKTLCKVIFIVKTKLSLSQMEIELSLSHKCRTEHDWSSSLSMSGVPKYHLYLLRLVPLGAPSAGLQPLAVLRRPHRGAALSSGEHSAPSPDTKQHGEDLFHSFVLYCTVLYCTVLYFTVLYCTVLYCTVRLSLQNV